MRTHTSRAILTAVSSGAASLALAQSGAGQVVADAAWPTFGGDLGFNDCKRCHSGPTFRMPM